MPCHPVTRVIILTVIGFMPPHGIAMAQNSSDPWFARDKALHFGASAGLASGGYAAGALVSDNTWVRLGIGGGVSLTAGVAKELWDLTGRGDPSWKDLSWDVIGAATGLLVSWSIDRLFFDSAHKKRPAPSHRPSFDAFSPFAFERPDPAR